MRDIFDNHLGESHVVLLSRLEQYGLKGLHSELTNEKDGFFVRFEVHTHVLAVSLSVFSTRDFGHLRVLHLAHCPLITGSLGSLTHCSSLEELNLWNCSHVTGRVSMRTLKWLSSLKRKQLYGTGLLFLSIDEEEDQQDDAFEALDLSTMNSLSGSLALLAKSSPRLKEVNLQSCSHLRDHGAFFAAGLAITKCNVAGTLALKSLEVFKTLEALVELNVSHCGRLAGTLSSLQNCKKLQSLDVSYCNKLTGSLTALSGGAASLHLLDVVGSSELTEVDKFNRKHWRCNVITSAPTSSPLKSSLGTGLVNELSGVDEPPLRVSTAKLIPQGTLGQVNNSAAMWHLTEEGLVRNAATGLVLEVEGHHSRYKTNVVANIRCVGPEVAPWQKWEITEHDELESALRPGLVLTIRNGSEWEHAQVWVHKRNHTDAQKWQFLDRQPRRSTSVNWPWAWKKGQTKKASITHADMT